MPRPTAEGASQDLQDRGQRFDRLDGDGIHDQLDVGDADVRVRGEGAGNLLVRAAQRRRGLGDLAARGAARATGQLDEHRHGPRDLGWVAASFARRVVNVAAHLGRALGRVADPVVPLVPHVDVRAAMLSIRGRVVPSISGGPSGRGPRGSSSQSRAL